MTDTMSLKRWKVGIIGSNNTGKSTLANALHLEFKKRGIRTDVAHESVRECPLGTKENTSVESAAWIILRQIQIEIVAQYYDDVVVADKTTIDTLAFGEWAFRLSENSFQENRVLLDWLRQTALGWASTYNVLFYVPLLQGVQIQTWAGVDDHHAEIDRLIVGILQEASLPHLAVGAGSVGERLQIAVAHLEERGFLEKDIEN